MDICDYPAQLQPEVEIDLLFQVAEAGGGLILENHPRKMLDARDQVRLLT